MWSKCSQILNRTNGFDLSRTVSRGGMLLLGSTLLTSTTVSANPREADGLKQKYHKDSNSSDVLLSRKIVSESDRTGLDLRIYQYQTCPYCCKVRAFLDYYGFSYEVVEVNPVTRSQINFSKDYKKVPIVKSSTLQQPMVESSLIISALMTYLLQKKKTLHEILEPYEGLKTQDGDGKSIMTYPNKFFIMAYSDKELSPLQIGRLREEREWREWVDDHFIHLISPNVYRTWSESLETFNYFDKVGDWKMNFPTWERLMAIYVGAVAMFFISKRLKKRHNIVDERMSMKDAFNEFLEAKGDRPFMGGDSPNLADLALYGAINSFSGCAAFNEMREKTKIGDWFDTMQVEVQEAKGKKLLEDKCNNQK